MATSYESFYQGGYSSLNPDYGNFVGYRLPGGKLAQSINPSTANQLDETVKALRTGLKEVEIQMLGISNDVDQQIPKEHFKEMRALMKLSGMTASLHGPIIDSAGFTGQGGVDETERIATERRFGDAMQKAKLLSPQGNIPVVFHASNGMQGPQITIDKKKKPGEKGRYIVEKDYIINRDTGQSTPLKRERKYFPNKPEDIAEGGTLQTPEEQIGIINATEWDNKMTELAQSNKHASEIMGNSSKYLVDYRNAIMRKDGPYDKDTNEKLPDLTPEQEINYNKMREANIFLSNVGSTFSGAFNRAYEYGSKEQREKLVELSKEYDKAQKKLDGNEIMQPIKQQDLLKTSIDYLDKITSNRNPETGKSDKNFTAPKLFQSAKDFALKKSSETFSNVAMESYKEFGKKMPTIAIENFAPGTAFSLAEDLTDLVKESRKKFAEKLQKEKRISSSQAKKIASKHIGATWDVGHINMHKKYGLTDEDVVKETEKIAPILKHLHLTDNFGFSDSHLVPGMGNVPFKKHLEKLEKAGVLDRVRKVVEAGGYIQQISQRGVHGDTISAFSSPIYGAKLAPYWNQISNIQGNYFGGYGNINPSTHHSIYGAGFTTLPTELGGNIPGGGSRFSGNSIA